MSGRPAPLFLFSLPRSGSTLAQRILAAHEPIATASEPWILLPYLYPLRKGGIYAEYNHGSLVEAIEDFCHVLPEGREDYLAEVRELTMRLYGKASTDGALYFLDKTPRYHLISEEIVAAFPEGKFVVLWRNPLAIVASIIETWSGGRWNLYRFKVDLFDGIGNLARTQERYGDRIHAVRYEDLVTHPERSWEGVFRYLDLPFEPSALEQFSSVKLSGRMGDTTGVEKYAKVSGASMEGWRQTLNNPFRKAWCRRYLRWIGRDRLALMGYDLDALLAELDSLPVSLSRLGSDVGRGCWGVVRDISEPRILGQKLSKLPAWRRVHVHR